MNRTRTKAVRKAEAEEPQVELPAETPRWAGPGDLGPPERGFEDVVLPTLGAMVRVRYVETAELAFLQMLRVDITGLAEQMERAKDRKKPRKTPKTSVAKLVWDEMTFLAKLAHLAIADPDTGEDPVPCDSCREGEARIVHPPSLFTVRQTARMHGDDLRVIGEIALKAQKLEFLRPFSPPQPELSTAESADSGE